MLLIFNGIGLIFEQDKHMLAIKNREGISYSSTMYFYLYNICIVLSCNLKHV